MPLGVRGERSGSGGVTLSSWGSGRAPTLLRVRARICLASSSARRF